MNLEDLAEEDSFDSRNIEKRRSCRQKPKFELYVDILDVLACSGPARGKYVADQAGFSSGLAKEKLGFLVGIKMVKEKTEKLGTIYSISMRGKRVLKYFLGTAALLPTEKK